MSLVVRSHVFELFTSLEMRESLFLDGTNRSYDYFLDLQVSLAKLKSYEYMILGR